MAAFQSRQSMIKLEELNMNKQQYTVITEVSKKSSPCSPKENALLLGKLRAIAEAVADRAEMHDIIGRQRNNWNHLFLHSINALALSASLMTGVFASLPSHLPAFKLSSVLLFLAAAGMMAIVNKIQPSQLAEEQRNATRLWKQLGRETGQMLSTKSHFTKQDVNLAMEKVLALDKAYPLPLLPGMLEKFPDQVEPTCWWPQKEIEKKQNLNNQSKLEGNGWNKELEEAMRGLLNVLRTKDEPNYVKLGKLVLSINKSLAVAGPLIAALSAITSGLVGSPIGGSWALVVSVVGGSLVPVVNTLEHGAQLGMIFELSRNCAGFYRRLQEDIEGNLSEPEVELRENGEVFALKVALQLGRNMSDLKEFASFASPSSKANDFKEFAGKLF
jgi:Petal formation-expressed